MTKGGDRRRLPDTRMLIKITIILGVRLFISTPYFPYCDQRFNVYQDQDCFFQKKIVQYGYQSDKIKKHDVFLMF